MIAVLVPIVKRGGYARTGMRDTSSVLYGKNLRRLVKTKVPARALYGGHNGRSVAASWRNRNGSIVHGRHLVAWHRSIVRGPRYPLTCGSKSGWLDLWSHP